MRPLLPSRSCAIQTVETFIVTLVFFLLSSNWGPKTGERGALEVNECNIYTFRQSPGLATDMLYSWNTSKNFRRFPQGSTWAHLGTLGGPGYGTVKRFLEAAIAGKAHLERRVWGVDRMVIIVPPSGTYVVVEFCSQQDRGGSVDCETDYSVPIQRSWLRGISLRAVLMEVQLWGLVNGFGRSWVC